MNAWLLPRSTRGAVSVESALVTPLLLVFFLLLIETARLSIITTLADQAAYTGTRTARINPGSDPALFIREDFQRMSLNLFKGGVLSVTTVHAPTLAALAAGDVEPGPGGANSLVSVTVSVQTPLLTTITGINIPRLGLSERQLNYRNEKI